MISVSTRLAVRNLGRNLRRTFLSVLGIGVGCAISLVISGFMRGGGQIYSRAAAEGGSGHLRVSPRGWLERREPKLRLAEGEVALATARSLPGVKVATPRSRAQALLAMGARVVSVELVGVDAATEPASFRYVRKVTQGRYLRPGETGAVVLGEELAKRLDATLDDDLVVTVVARGGQMQSAMLRVVGLTSSGSRTLDAGICQTSLADVEKLTGLPGYGEVSVILGDERRLEAAQQALLAKLTRGDAVLSWGEVMNELRDHLRQDTVMRRLLATILLLLVVLGVASAQLTAVLERRREFAVFSAIGMKPFALVRQLVLESAALGLGGAVAALLIGGPITWYFATRGLDIYALVKGGDLTFEGIMMEPRFYADFGVWMLPHVLGVSLAAAAIASLYPAWFAARTDPASALRVAQ